MRPVLALNNGPPRFRKGQDLACRVTRVVDGDTVVVEVRSAGECRVRLYAIDAPEMDQPLGPAARDYLAQKMAGASCHMRVMDIDRYQRVVAVLYQRRYRDSVNLDMVQAGYAYAYERYGSLPGLQRAEQQAKARKRGVWQEANPIPPWEHRQGRRPAPERKKGCCGPWLWVPLLIALLFVLAWFQG